MLKYIVTATLMFLVGCSQGLYDQGRKLVDEGKYDRAIELFYEQIRSQPQSAQAWRELGIALYKKGELIKAEDALKQANAIQPDSRSNLYMGLIYEKQEMHDRAIEAYRMSLALKPKGKTEEMIRTHLNGLIAKKIEHEVSMALANESDINADTIPDNTIAVVDFDNSHLPPELAPISKGLAEFTALDLAKVKSLRVVDRLKIDVILAELKLSSSQYADPSTAPRMGRLLGSNRIVTGTVLGIGDDAIQLDGAVVSTRDSAAATTGTTEGPLQKFFEVQKDFVFKVVDQMGLKLTAEERDAIEEIPTESYLAFLAYCRGLDYKSRGMFTEAQQQFHQAIREDNGFSQAQVQNQSVQFAPMMGKAPATFDEFESSLVSASDEETTTEDLSRFQSGSLGSHGFIRDPGSLDRYGNSPDSPPRTYDLTGVGTVIIRGNLDAQP